MQINQEACDTHSIQSYTDKKITINHIDYHSSLIVGRNTLITPWPIDSIVHLNETLLAPMLALKPEVILIGQNNPQDRLPMLLLHYLAQKRIGVECMSIGASARTFNVLLSEERAVILGVIL